MDFLGVLGLAEGALEAFEDYPLVVPDSVVPWFEPLCEVAVRFSVEAARLQHVNLVLGWNADGFMVSLVVFAPEATAMNRALTR